MEDSVRTLLIDSLRAKLELCRIIATALMERIESPLSDTWDRRAAFRQWADVTRDGDALALALQSL